MKTIQKHVGFFLQRRKIWEGKCDYPRPLMFSFCYHAKYLTTTTGLRVSDSNWDSGKQRVKIGVKHGAEINQYLDKLAEKLNDIYFTALSKDIKITNAYILTQLKRDRNGEGEKPKTFWNYYDEYLIVKKRLLRNSSYKSALLYARELRKSKKVSINTPIIAYVLGSEIEAEANEIVSEGPIKIIPHRYNTILAKAHSRTFNLIRKIEEIKKITYSNEIDDFFAEPENSLFRDKAN